MKVYYNEFDKKKCAALQALMDDGHISKGDIDDRSISDVRADELKEYDRAHFFAGIGLWDHALNLARWPEGLRVWTGSCPCQPYSSAGRQKGKADDRHLWPEWERLIEKSKPPVIFGEQVASAIAHGWLDDVYQGLEAQGYAVGSAVLPASAVGAPHRRERLFFVGHAISKRLERWRGAECSEQRQDRQAITRGFYGEPMANLHGNGFTQEGERFSASGSDGIDGNCSALANAECRGSSRQGQLQRSVHSAQGSERQADRSINDSAGHWQSGTWINCPDGKQRLIEPRISLLAHGYPEGVGLIHAAGDAIVPQVAAEFISAAYEAMRGAA